MATRRDIESRAEELFRPLAQAAGCDILCCEWNRAGKHSVLRVFIDHKDGVNVDHCAAVSRAISDLVDEDGEWIPGQWNLEVSSPGLDRPLKYPAHFQAHLGEKAKVRLFEKFQGRRRFTGTIAEVDGDIVGFQVEDETLRLPVGAIERARLSYDYSQLFRKKGRS